MTKFFNDNAFMTASANSAEASCSCAQNASLIITVVAIIVAAIFVSVISLRLHLVAIISIILTAKNLIPLGMQAS